MESSTVDTYSFLLSDDTLVPFKRSLLRFFKTMKTMVKSMGYDIKELPPLPDPLPLPTFITKPIIEYCIRMASRQQMSRLNVDSTDVSFIASVINALNYLDAIRILGACIDKLYSLLNSIPTTELGLLSPLPADEEWPPLTPYFRRVEAIHGFLVQALPDELRRAKFDVQKHATLIGYHKCHSLTMASRTSLLGHGTNRCGALGLPYAKEVSGVKEVEPPGGDLLLVSCGKEFSFCLTTTGLYSCGSNLFGELGVGNSELAYSGKWLQVEVSGEVLQIATGENHVIIHTTTGLYGTGQNTLGQLGLTDLDLYWGLTRIHTHGEVIAIVCDRSYTIVLTSKGLYGCGSEPHQPYAAHGLYTYPKVVSHNPGQGLELIPGFTGRIESITDSFWKNIISSSHALRSSFCFKK